MYGGAGTARPLLTSRQLITLQTTGICEKPAGAAAAPGDDLVYDNPVDDEY